MFLGMGIVFVFLIILVLAVQLVSVIVRKFFPEAEESIESAIPARTSGDAEIAAAVAAVKSFTKP